jgi:cytochrome c oxidase subunit 3
MEIPYTAEPRKDTGLFNAKVGIWLFLASEVMLFGALFSSYILLRVGAAPGDWPHGLLNVKLGMINTIVLICSSITVVMAWASLKMNQFGKFRMYQAITLLCALLFVCIKSVEYKDKFSHYEIHGKVGATVMAGEGKEAKPVVLTADDFLDGHLLEQDAEKVVIHGHVVNKKKAAEVTHAWQEREIKEEEITIKKEDIAPLTVNGREVIHDGKKELAMESDGPWHNTYMAIYVTLTGLHALHVIGGALVIGFIWGPLAGMWKTDPERYTNRIEVSGLFWHFVDLVWIFLFPVLYLL